uniref:hypothetical protein n=2 Tax=Leptospira borgpetersenii TaxID=174 RepID=UPI002955A2C6
MRLFRKIKSEEAPDTLTHLYLNPENSSWGNFGYWKNTADYPTACKTLARLLGERADLKRGLKVLDLEPVSKLLVLRKHKNINVKCTNIIQ